MKNNRNGQAAVFTAKEYSRIRNNIHSQKYKLLLDLAWFTGERWGALVQMKIADLYDAEDNPLKLITFRARTRKAVGGKKKVQKTRQVPVHPTLHEALKAYKREDPESEWLFPSKRSYTEGEISKHISLRYADMVFREAVQKAGLESRGLSTHSSRRSFVTHLARNGVSLRIIQKLLGYTDLKMLAVYIDVNDADLEGAIATL
ncbi:MAG: tyrosine-type recombinase/integrase [Nostoc sp. NMS1]|uniref:tyrosine-type recombinase/integrase n=1 Tax=unclassified Nostoc TaxID=2593658 RepID=UPI0025D63176|nr:MULTISPECIES: tyrosine-type recombinase/integrase [unclassified Nostoc]MBN3905121.1 tyrosine-type recombinase/integrase [Nostoc sp. NMS1]MBN3989225.1 tyrosine-type recombinase/integrase [Nostoc sp. NMS2]